VDGKWYLGRGYQEVSKTEIQVSEQTSIRRGLVVGKHSILNGAVAAKFVLV
jgi:hypothetical protein